MKARKARKGEAQEWLRSFLAYPPATDECVLWPFSCNRAGREGYPQIAIGRRPHRVSRIVLAELVGPPPHPQSQAAHAPVICHEPRCVNPRHLRWATPADNMADKLLDGTHNRGSAGRAELTEVRALAIYHAGGTQAAIAKRYGVSRSTVASIKVGARWSWLTGHSTGV